MSDLPPAGWYADPEYPGYLRYWDAQQWTEHRQPDAATQTAGTTSPAGATGPSTPGSVGPAATHADPAPSSSPDESPPLLEPQVVRASATAAGGIPSSPAPAGAWDPSGAPPGRRRGVSAAVVAVIAVFTLLLGAVAGFTLGRLTADDDGLAGVVDRNDDGTLRPGDGSDRVTLELDGRRVTAELVLDGDRDVRIEARSSDFDTTLRLYDDTGNEIAFDDDGLGEDLNSLLDLFLDAGTYEVEVAPFEDGMSSGRVEITVR